jgi:hypothetical protein
MRYLCTIYANDGTFPGTNTSPASGSPAEPTSAVASVVVTGSSLRQAAARAYVRCVGRERARWLRQAKQAPAAVVAQETSPKAIALSLRKVHRRFGECYEMDNYHDVWSIKVEPAPMSLRQLRLTPPLLYHLSLTPSPN